MSLSGRPLRFLAAVSGGWVLFRVVALWPQIDSVEALTRAVMPMAAAAAVPSQPVATPTKARSQRRPMSLAHLRPKRTPAVRPRPDPQRVALALLGFVRFGNARGLDAPPGLVAGLPRPETAAPSTSRFGASAWLFVRGGTGTGAGLVGGQLGGSQAGARLTYALAPRVALAARFSTPLTGAGREFAAGIEWRPMRLPIRFVAERRVSLDGGRGGTVLGAVGGFGPQAVGHGIRAEIYGQTGYILRRDREAFADGAFRLSRTITTLDKIGFDLGAGAWGAAQRGAARLDIGPSLSASVPIAGGATRLSLDWRQRVAGQARPGSGLVVTLGTDF